MPQPLRDEFVQACINTHIPVPLVAVEWEELWREVGAAFVAMLAIVAFNETADGEFGQDASILFRDRSKRAYTFTAIVESARAPPSRLPLLL